jgi:hypothetical protein
MPLTASSASPDVVSQRDRLVSAFQIVPTAVDDVRATARDFQASSDAYGQTRAELGLSELRVWLQTNAQGTFMIVEIVGDLESYFHRIRTDSGLDGWTRDKVAEWVGSRELAERLYEYPQTEELLSWVRPDPAPHSNG